MKKIKINSIRFLIIAVAALSTLVSLNINNDRFYYAFDEKVILKSKPNKLLVKYKHGTDVQKT